MSSWQQSLVRSTNNIYKFLFHNGCYIPKHTGGRNTQHWYFGTRDLVLFIYLFILETHRWTEHAALVLRYETPCFIYLFILESHRWTEHAALVLRYERLLSGRQKRRYQCSEMWEVRGEHSISKAFCTNTHTDTHKKVSMWEVRGEQRGGGQTLQRALRQGHNP